jgi:histone arginine demethylase JMJD6
MAISPLAIRRVDAQGITHKQFIQEHWLPGIPLILRNACAQWRACDTFVPDWFRANYGSRLTSVEGAHYTMREIMDLVEGKDTTRPVPYPCKYHIEGQLPELLEYLQPLDMGLATPNWLDRKWFASGNWGNAVELFIGGPGGRFPYIHLDYYHLSAWITQLYGRKEFTVWPRGQEIYLYPDPENPWRSLVPDHENPDLERFPLLRNATPIKCIVGPGETLFIPFGIWHTAHSLEPTISVAFDLLNAHNFPAFLRDVWTLRKGAGIAKAAAVVAYATVAGSLCWLEDRLRPQVIATPPTSSSSHPPTVASRPVARLSYPGGRIDGAAHAA